jgi:hypothetical protein
MSNIVTLRKHTLLRKEIETSGEDTRLPSRLFPFLYATKRPFQGHLNYFPHASSFFCPSPLQTVGLPYWFWVPSWPISDPDFPHAVQSVCRLLDSCLAYIWPWRWRLYDSPKVCELLADYTVLHPSRYLYHGEMWRQIVRIKFCRHEIPMLDQRSPNTAHLGIRLGLST